MNSTTAVFQFDDLNVRALVVDGEPWFVVADLALALGYDHAPHAARMLDEDEKGVHKVDTPGGKQRMAVCSESGLYALVLRSQKPEAKRFRKWVTGTVLPCIRKTGQYQADWRKQRHQCAASYKVMSDILRMTREDEGKATATYHYSNEARLINSLLTGQFKGLDRDKLNAADLALLAHLEERNGILLARDVSYDQRKEMLKQYAMDWRLAHGTALAAPVAA